MKLEPGQYRRIDESMARWCNRLREDRGNDHVVWRESDDGSLYLTSALATQNKLDFVR